MQVVILNSSLSDFNDKPWQIAKDYSNRGGKTTKVPDFRAAITVTTLTMNENAFSLPKTMDFTPRTEPLKFCRFRPILAIFSESVK